MTALCREALVVWTGRDNAADLVLLADELPVDPTAITRVVLELSETETVDSQTTPAAFEWPVDLTYGGEDAKGVRVKLGGLGIAAGLYSEAWLIVYDPDHANGLVWSDRVPVRIT